MMAKQLNLDHSLLARILSGKRKKVTIFEPKISVRLKELYSNSDEIHSLEINVSTGLKKITKSEHMLLDSFKAPLIQEATKVEDFAESDYSSKTIELLLEKGFLKRLSNGSLVDSEPNWYSDGFDSDPNAKKKNAQDFKELSERAHQAHSDLEEDLILFSWVMHTMQSSRVPRVKKILPQFRRELSKVME